MNLNGPRLAITAGTLGLLGATNRWTSWSRGARLLRARDEGDYRTIALAAPHLPKGHLANQHAQVFALNYVVGLIKHATGANIDVVFRVCELAIILATVLLLHVALGRAGVSTPAFAACMALFVLNTYSLRYYLIALGYVTDLTFVLTLLVMVIALHHRRYWTAVIAISIGVLGRQSGIPMTVAAAYWVAFGSGWRAAPTRVRQLRAAGIIAIPSAVYATAVAISTSFSYSNTPGIKGLTILGDIERLPHGLKLDGEHILRVANPLLAVAALLVVALLAWRADAPREPRLPFAVRGCLVVAASLWLQPVFLSPRYTGHPERLVVLALIPLVLALAVVLRELERRRGAPVISAATAAVMVGVLALASLHYLYTWFGPSTAVEGGVLQAAGALIVAALLWHELKPAGRGGSRREEQARVMQHESRLRSTTM